MNKENFFENLFIYDSQNSKVEIKFAQKSGNKISYLREVIVL